MVIKRRKQIILIFILLFALGIGYLFCIPCQFLGWMRMPSVSEVLANPEPKPIHLVEISNGDISSLRLLCVHVSKAAFVKETGDPHGMLADLPAQIVNINKNFEKSFQFYIDGWRKPVTSIEWSDVGPFIKCVDTTGENPERHMAYIQYRDMDGAAYSYTWVFEVKADGIVPEVKATAS